MANSPRVVPFRPRGPQPPPGGWPSWYQSLRRDNGRVIPDLANVLIALRGDPEMDHALAFDEMRWRSIVQRPLPATDEGRLEKPVPHETDDDDIVRVQEWLQVNGMPRIGRETIGNGFEMLAHERAFHPIKLWLDNVAWDGEPRIYSNQGPWLTTYLGAVSQPLDYLATIGQCFLVSMIARIYEPPCKADYMLVLEGDQGVEKSRACAALAERWFGDCLPDIHTKDAKQYLGDKWLVEVSELSAFSKADIETLKAFITRESEDYRPPYGKLNVVRPRQCVFIGTTNRLAYIKDDTGARRFWPVRVGKIDVDGLKRDRDQLFAEALALYHDRTSWWPSPELEQKWIKPEQETRVETEAWEADIAAFLAGGVTETNRVTVTEVARNALGFENSARVKMADANRIIGVLHVLGWKAGRDYKGRFYAKP